MPLRPGRPRGPMRPPRSPTPSPRSASPSAGRWRPGPSTSSASTATRSASGRRCRSRQLSRPASRPASTCSAASLARRCASGSRPPTRIAQLGEALDRWELSLFQAEPFRSEQLRTSLEALLGAGDGLWAAALRAAVLLGDSGRERAEQHARLRPLVEGHDAGEAANAVRDALVEALLYGDRVELAAALDESLLGTRPAARRPPARALGASRSPRRPEADTVCDTNASHFTGYGRGRGGSAPGARPARPGGGTAPRRRPGRGAARRAARPLAEAEQWLAADGPGAEDAEARPRPLRTALDARSEALPA